ncbi:MAG: hypothetical protein WCP21_03575 [Armatimonadota bacterium]
MKCQDEVESGKQRMTHIEIHDRAQLFEMTVEDYFVHIAVRPHFA